MNVFLLDPDPLISAIYLVDDHVAFVTTHPDRKPIRSCKMAIEACQLLSSVHWYGADRSLPESEDRSLWPAPYRSSHQNHPWAVAVRSSLGAYLLVREHVQALLLEHEHRTGRTMDGVQAALDRLWKPPEWLESRGWCVPVCRAGHPVEYVSSVEEAVGLYREYYRSKIEKMNRFTKRTAPEWMGRSEGTSSATIVSDEWFSSQARIARFLRHPDGYWMSGQGDPRHTLSDVETALQGWVRESGLAEEYAARARREQEERELRQLANLKAKYEGVEW